MLAYERYLHTIFKHTPLLSRVLSNSFLANSTLTLQVHNFPGDYYRFSRQAFEEVFFAEMEKVTIRSIMAPPRIIGAGIKP